MVDYTMDWNKNDIQQNIYFAVNKIKKKERSVHTYSAHEKIIIRRNI